MKLSGKQNEIVTSQEKFIIVDSAPASGKTRVLTERVKYLLSNGIEPEDIALVTFTNAAAYEMAKRIGEDSNRMFIGTIHSLANRCLKSAGIDTSHLLAAEDYNGLFKLIMENKSCVRPIKHLLLDEAQDSSEEQFNFILDIINPDNFMFVGDVNQAIYNFAGGRADILQQLEQEDWITTYQLNENYRNSYEILEFAKDIICEDSYDPSISMNGRLGDVFKIDDNIDSLVSLIKFSEDSYKDWFVLTRTNAQLEEVYSGLSGKGIPCDTFKKAALNTNELVEKMQENTVKVLTIHTAKGLENKNVIVIGTTRRTPEERRVAYVAATRAIDTLYWCKRAKRRGKPRNDIFCGITEW